jgi:hypothetical protein
MKFLKGMIVGGIIIGALAFGAGYNHGRGAEIVSNPFGERTLSERVQKAQDEGREAIDELLDGATGN